MLLECGFTYIKKLSITSESEPIRLIIRPAGKILALIYAGHGYVYAYCENFLKAGEYSHDYIRAWFETNPDAVIISDDPEKAMGGFQVKPDLYSLCEIALKNLNRSINPMELKISYYRAPN